MCTLRKNGTTHFTTQEAEVRHLVFTPEFKVAELNVDGAKSKAILKDIQFHPVKDTITHIDFLELTEGNPVKVEIPLKTKGSSPGVKVGGKLIQSVRKIKVKTVPEKIGRRIICRYFRIGTGTIIEGEGYHCSRWN